MDIESSLLATKAATMSYFDLPDEDLAKAYGPGKWSVRYLLNHLADSETVFLYRLRRVISERNQVIWAYDQDAWAKALDYSTWSLDLARSLYTASRDGVLRLARQHYSGAEHVTFVHSATGTRTLKDEFDKVAWHNQLHMDHIRMALQ